MTIWTKFKDFVERVAGEESAATSLQEEELRLAAAALLVHATVVDGKADRDERQTLKSVLERRFDLSGAEASRLVGDAEAREQDAVDLYGFTSVLCRQLDQDGRKRIIEMLWEVVMADGTVHEFESNLVWRAAELLGVSARDRILLRKVVASRNPDGRSDG